MKRLCYILLSLAVVCSCTDPLADTALKQEEQIESFISSKYADADVVFNEGVNRILLEAGDSTCFAAKGDMVSFDYIAYPFTSSIGDPYASGSYSVRLGDGKLLRGLEYGLEGMCPGEHSYIVFSCKYAYDKTVAGMGEDQALAFEVLMNEINPE